MPNGQDLAMTTFHLNQKSRADGILSVEIPVGVSNADCEIVVLVGQKHESRGWRPDFWERLSKGTL